MEDRNPALCMAFIEKAKQILTKYPSIKYEWSIDEDKDHCILWFKKESEDGFDIIIEVFPGYIILSPEGTHVHFDLRNNIESIVDDVLGLTRDLLSQGMRVREISSNGSPFKWYLESIHNGRWRIENSSNLVFYSYFGKKTEKIYQNSFLPKREF